MSDRPALPHPAAGEGDLSEGLLEDVLREEAESEPEELDDCDADPDVDLDLLEGIANSLLCGSAVDPARMTLAESTSQSEERQK